jgi:hypothetical protein
LSLAAATASAAAAGDAKDRERLSISHRGKRKFGTESFDLEKSNEVEIRKDYHI